MNDVERKVIRPKIERKLLIWILGILMILGLPGREILQLIIIRTTVDNIAQQLDRFLATTQYYPDTLQTEVVRKHAVELLEQKYNMVRLTQKTPDGVTTITITPDLLTPMIANWQFPNNGTENYIIKEAIIESARYYSALDVIEKLKGTLPKPDNLRIVTCSDALGYKYDGDRDQCYPYNDVGEDGSHVFVSVSYEYQIGSSIGLNLGTYNFHAYKEGINECGFCSNYYLVVRLSGNVPDQYSMSLIDLAGKTISIECKKGENPGNGCLSFGARFSHVSSNKLTITIKWDTGNYSEVIEPSYVDYPNRRCEGFCKNGLIDIVLP